VIARGTLSVTLAFYWHQITFDFFAPYRHAKLTAEHQENADLIFAERRYFNIARFIRRRSIKSH
jgi:hypothetical protein